MPVPAQSVGNLHVSASRQRLVVQMQEVEPEDLQNLKRSYNALSVTNSIPPEILSNIFIIHNASILKASILKAYPSPTSQREAFSWIYVAHVCHHWREVALNCGALWSNLLFLKPSLTETMLSRSKNSPLSVKLQLGHNNPAFEPLLCKILSQTHRLRSVNLSGTVKDTLLSNASGNAPFLEELSLACVANLSSKIPKTFLQGGAPSLKEITLKGIDVPFWGSLPLGPNLTHLRLDLKSVGHAHRPSASTFLKSLEDLLSLRLLSLSGALPINTYPTRNSTSSPPTFPNLRDLFLNDTFTALRQFVQAEAIKVPKTAMVRITVDDAVEDAEAIGHFLLELRERWDGLKTPAHRLELYKGEYTNDLGFNLYLDPSSNVFRRNRPALVLNFDDSVTRLTCSDILKAFAKRLDLSQVESLTISEGSTPLTAEEWGLAGINLKGVKTIIFETADVRDFLDQLGVVPTHIESAVPVTVPFLSLSKLAFHSLDFGQYFDTGSEFASALIGGIKRQQEASHISMKLEMIRCNGFNHTQHRQVCESLPKLRFMWDYYDDDCDEADEDEDDEDEDDEDEDDEDEDDEDEGEWEDEDTVDDDEDDVDSDVEDDSDEDDET
ncbi:hypothetical protein D9611_005032 [Ephemerocybe angulata]|uniref:F-box domain-containing protein n=1 Tax=Ephemerocybe angulata TaxID=980116 RepID=A0A8H5B3J8_9AGAR|nr:hypothetical protein D9611_005032 [Tulosesus angulatus]